MKLTTKKCCHRNICEESRRNGSPQGGRTMELKMKQAHHQEPMEGKMGLLMKTQQDKRNTSFFATLSEDPLAHAFEKKTVIHAGLGGTPVPRQEIASVWEKLAATPRSGKTAAYIHIPFCKTHCLYCGFYSNPATGDFSRPYSDALIRELQQDSNLAVCQEQPVHAVYLGGGTPTDLEAQDLERLLGAIKECLPLANDCEITVEGRILEFDQEKIDACIRGGANRFSLGVQTFNTEMRQTLGRVSSRETIVSTLKYLKKIGHAAVIIDLIFGLPGQDADLWQRDIETFLELELDGVDLYQLILYKGGALEKHIQKGTLPPAADTPEKSRLFALGVQLMENARYRRLSISHWGRTTRERNQYNLFMKQKAHCLAYGSGAGGNLHGYAFFLDNKLESYMNRNLSGEKSLAMMLFPSPNEALIKIISGELELGRMDLKKAGKQLNMDIEKRFAPPFKPMAGRRTYPPERGMDGSDPGRRVLADQPGPGTH